MLTCLKVQLHKSIISFLFLIALSFQAVAQMDTLRKWNIKPFLALHTTNFDWSIAGTAAGTDPNILSELVWTNLRGPGAGLELKYMLSKNFSLKTASEYYIITKGQATDTDYADDNRENPFYEDFLNAGKGHLHNSSLQLSYQALTFRKLSIAPIVGATYSRQEFLILESINDPRTEGLNSTYEVTYRGFDFGTAIVFKNRLFNLTTEILGGFYKYGAKANWNLIPDFQKPVSFIHRANSFNLAGNVNLSIPINKQLKFELDYKTKKMKAHSGIDRAFYINQPVKETLFNGSTLITHVICLGLSFSF